MCPHQKIIDLYNNILGKELSRVKSKLWNGTRQVSLQSRWKEDKERQNVEWWEKYFEEVNKSDFLMGRVPGRNGQQPFRADMGWLINKSNIVKVLEGKYLNKNSEEVW